MALATGALYAAAGQNDSRHDPSEHAHARGDMPVAAQCRMAYGAVEQLNRTLNPLRSVTDPVRLRAAVKEMHEPVREARQHLGSCLDILKLMQSSETPAEATPPAASTPF